MDLTIKPAQISMDNEINDEINEKINEKINENNNFKINDEMINDPECFEIIRTLRPTSQGYEFIAKIKKIGKCVLIKKVFKQLVESERTLQNHHCTENFLEERSIIAYLSVQPDCHPAFARMLGQWDDEQCYYYATEWSQYSFFSFRQQFRNKQNDLIKNCQKIFFQLVDFIYWLHSKEICHLGLNVENIMIHDMDSMMIKINNFGFAKRFWNNNFTNDQVVNKIEFMCPEILAKQDYDSRSADIWSLGIILFTLMTGKPPFQSPSSNCQNFKRVIANGLGNKTDYQDLLTKIFKYENDRISIKDLKRHPFFKKFEDGTQTPKEENINKREENVAEINSG